MTQNLKDFLTGAKNKEFATKSGTDMHTKMQRVVVHADERSVGDTDILEIIKNRADLLPFFVATNFPQTEVPIAGYINGVFVSRRIDRLLINHGSKTVEFIDYKTDIDKTEFIEKYKKQLREYAILLRSAYPDYEIRGYILWLHDWMLDRVI